MNGCFCHRCVKQDPTAKAVTVVPAPLHGDGSLVFYIDGVQKVFRRSLGTSIYDLYNLRQLEEALGSVKDH